MTTTRPMGSLTPTLLARKGAARPAMRPQLQPMRAFQENPRQLEDLGWNDMGGDLPQVAPEPAAPVTVAPVEVAPAEVVAIVPAVEPAPAAVSQVAALQKKIAEHVNQERAPKEKAISRRSALSDGRRAAFTLRLDGERHLKLRLACVTSNRSAQQIVTEALDRLIADLPDVAELADTVRKGR